MNEVMAAILSAKPTEAVYQETVNRLIYVSRLLSRSFIDSMPNKKDVICNHRLERLEVMQRLVDDIGTLRSPKRQMLEKSSNSLAGLELWNAVKAIGAKETTP